MSSLTIYTTPACHACTFSKRYMTDHGITFEAIDVTTNPEGLSVIKSLGYGTAPVFVVADGSHFQGFQPDLINAAAGNISA
jgi:glutaredoxin-like protein NrdH